MNFVDYIDKIAISLIPVVIIAIAGFHMKMAGKNYEKIKSMLTMLECRHEALVYALQRHSKNGFLEYYNERLDMLMEERKYINRSGNN